MKLALIYNHESPSTAGAYIERALQKAGIAHTLFGVNDSQVIPHGFDCYLRIDHGDYKFDIPADLHPAVFYGIDTHLPKPYRKICEQVRHYDVVFCAQKDGALRLRRETGVDCQWLPLACDPDIDRKVQETKMYDIGFVGRDAVKFDRGRHLALLRKHYTNAFIGAVEHTKKSEVYSASRIGFNSSIKNDINMRIFEIMASGCFLLTNVIHGNGFAELFKDGEHCRVYRNEKELLVLIEYYLKNENEREKIAQAGYELVLKEHTYYHRIQTMFNYLAFKFGGEFNSLRV